MTQTVPAVTVYTCDMCKKQVNEFCGTAKIHLVSRDFSGAIVGGVNHDIDLCEGCARDVYDFIKSKNV